MRGLFEQVLERAHAQGGLRADFAFADLAVLLWSFGPLIDATAELGSTAWAAAPAPGCSTGSGHRGHATERAAALGGAMRLLRERRLGRRAGRS